LTDLPLINGGEEQARRLHRQLLAMKFTKVLSSPLQRAMRTCELSGHSLAAEVDDDLVEWNYGDCEGKKRPEILTGRPSWIIFRDGCPGGESPQDVGIRADRVISRIRRVQGNVLVFSSGHFLRVLIAQWLGLGPSGGRFFKLGTATLSVLGYDHDDHAEPVLRQLNESMKE
jgi:broad specificity phosphatase PhoE